MSTATLAVTACGIVAPGVAGPAAALRPAPEPGADWFDPATALPGRGYKKVPEAGQYLLAAARAALAADAGAAVTATDPDRVGIVVGTNNAGAETLEAMDRTIIDGAAEELSPARTPYMAMSLFVSRLSMEHRVNGLSLTVNSPATAGIDAIGVAARALAVGRAAVLLVGAVEAPPPRHRFAGSADCGAALLICESADVAAARGARVHGYCSARSAFLDPSAPDAAPVLEQLLGEALSGPDAVTVDAVLDDSPVGVAVAQWLSAHVGADLLTLTHTVADAGCLTPIRLLVGRLAAPTAPRRRLVLTAAVHGNLALADLTTEPGRHDPKLVITQ
ncbi:beta-ketoacyl synthase N-terminal-like domain-containing protein [Nocardia sp. NPDC049149]|uniref:beta-ketoacyl synthase N-terminal-like domain-containing protein n=1 Tax=Nocardia sp. NPDC049149 TaxID=3364315 RepID=UPI00371D6E2F